MSDFIVKATVAEWSFAGIGILGALSACIGIIFKGTRESRCQSVSCCCHLLDCNNDPLDKDEMAVIKESGNSGTEALPPSKDTSIPEFP